MPGAPLGPRSRSSGDRTRRQRMDTGSTGSDRFIRIFAGIYTTILAATAELIWHAKHR